MLLNRSKTAIKQQKNLHIIQIFILTYTKKVLYYIDNQFIFAANSKYRKSMKKEPTAHNIHIGDYREV